MNAKNAEIGILSVKFLWERGRYGRRILSRLIHEITPEDSDFGGGGVRRRTLAFKSEIRARFPASYVKRPEQSRGGEFGISTEKNWTRCVQKQDTELRRGAERPRSSIGCLDQVKYLCGRGKMRQGVQLCSANTLRGDGKKEIVEKAMWLPLTLGAYSRGR